ncbi:glycosyltransferase family 4 protein [Subtercola lobariae]|uniref:Glycosyl transferase family 1 domain-containing protein n=1 Tax=Subtercola lobariae TaxID=1588641 RepID=A0A917B0C6_9MICO|nr:glycosyltransferase family 1 protein [Subtercola lobariae]GGF14181.1 hypothetical protein GCM10011399_05060 [Subtercola lobariae]
MAESRALQHDPAPLLAPLTARLNVMAPYFLGESAPTVDDSGAGALAGQIARTAFAASDRFDTKRRDHLVWLMIVTFTAVYPTQDEHRAVRRALGLAREGSELDALLGSLEPIIRRSYQLNDELEPVRGGVIIDADFTGRSDHNTGVQRVLRETASRWDRDHELTLVCWNDSGTGMRYLVGHEVSRVTDWAARSAMPDNERFARDRLNEDARVASNRTVVVPVRCVIVEVEVSQVAVAAPLAALAAVSGSDVVMVGHDTIPVVSAESQETAEIERFARYLTVVKNASRIAGVSASAAAEFAGFVSAVSAQGITGPEVLTVPLAMNAPERSSEEAGAVKAQTAGAAPLVLVVGSQEPRKNHESILFAAQQLASAGHRFRLRFIGGGSAATMHHFDAKVRLARHAGADVEVLRGASDRVLLESYEEARFTIFPSLHEGFGLPVAESLSLGTPVITSDHGSLAEAAAGGGCLTVDARDDEALRVAMLSLLTDEDLYQRLRTEAIERSFRSWNDYAADLWQGLVAPSRASVLAGSIEEATGVRSLAEADNTASGAGTAAQHVLEQWWADATEEVRLQEIRRNSLVGKVSRIVPLAKFFVVRSREMGVVPASQAAYRIVRRRIAKG